MVSYFKLAQEATAAGDFGRAILLYEQAILAHPALEAIYRVNLARARVKLGSHQTSVSVAPNTASIQASGKVFLSDLYRQVEQAVQSQETRADSPQPLVSVIMTTHNVQDYIEQAVTSVVRQTHQPLELIVVDDASTDGTWALLQRLGKEFPLVCRQLNANLGTYFAKNLGVTLARGEFVFFQDGDDIGHPERIRLMLGEFTQPNVMCVQGSYSRVGFPSGQVYPVNGLVQKPGLITLGMRRQVFEDIGYFNCTTKASDNEFFERLRAYYAPSGGLIHTSAIPLYYNTYRDGSLFADMVANNPTEDGYISQVLSPMRAQYVDAFTKVHQSVPAERFRAIFKFPVIRDVIPVAPGMTRLANPKQPVVLSLCSIPERQALLQRTLASLASQVDEVHLYLDRYTAVPSFISVIHPKVHVVRSQDAPGLRDNGKFLPLLSLAQPCYFFTADDDIEYPPDYVNAMLAKLEHYGGQAVVGVHGVLVPDQAEGYFSSWRRVFLFSKGLAKDQLVNNLGTGTVAFDTSCLPGLDYRKFAHAGMADLYLSVFCKRQGVPMVAVARPDDWLKEQPSGSPTLYTEFSQNDANQSHLIRTHGPWGYESIAQTLAALAGKPGADEAVVKLQALMPLMTQCLWG
jgi:glycosyltransferase involved in cell wall biosynthesis